MDEKILKINKIGKAGHIISKIVMVFLIIGIIATGGLAIAGLCVPNDIATVSVDGTAQINISEKYLQIGSAIFEEVNNGMTEEGQTLTIGDTKYQYVVADTTGDKINIEYKSLGNNITVRTFARMLAGECLSLVNSFVLIIFVIQLFKAIKTCQSPFEEGILDKMKKIAIVLVPYMVIDQLAKSITDSAFSNNVDIHLGVNLSMVLVILVLVGLIFIFKYGADLQQQSDETL